MLCKNVMGNVFIREICILTDCNQLEEDKILKMFDMENIFFVKETFCTKMENKENELNF